MTNRQRMELLFKQIAEGFNLTEGEVETTLKLNAEGLKSAIRDCFRQIEKPRDKFSEDYYKYLTEVVGCVNLEEQLEQSDLEVSRTLTECIVSVLFDMPIKFTLAEATTSVYLKRSKDGYTESDFEAIVRYTIDLLSHPKVKYLVKDGEYYSLNLSAKLN